MNAYERLEAVMDSTNAGDDTKDLAWMELSRLCTQCRSGRESYEHYDRHGIYSGKACESEQCISKLPGQGSMWNYDAEEPLGEDL